MARKKTNQTSQLQNGQAQNAQNQNGQFASNSQNLGQGQTRGQNSNFGNSNIMQNQNENYNQNLNNAEQLNGYAQNANDYNLNENANQQNGQNANVNGNQSCNANGTYQNSTNGAGNGQNPFVNVEKDAGKAKEKKERNWVIKAGNMAILASSLSLVIDVVHKLLRMVLIAYSGLIIFLYVLAGILSIFALFASIKYGFKQKGITVDAFFTGISFVALILI